MLNSSAEYALEAALLLAREAPDGRRTSAELAEALELPANFLSKLLARLRREGVLESRRGPRGGFRLARPPGDVSLAEVVGPFDDVVRDRPCLLTRSACRDDLPCAAHERWKSLAGRIRRFFRETTLADLGPGPEVGLPVRSGSSNGAARGRPADAMARGEEPA